MNKQIINTKEAPAPIGPYSHAVEANGTLYISGQIPIDPATNAIVSGDIKTETHQCMKNLEAILKTAGLGFENVVKTTIFLSDMGLFADVNEVYGSYLSGGFPARETVTAKGLPKGVNVEISMIAVR